MTRFRRPEAELAKDARDVPLDRGLRDDEGVGDPLVRHALGHGGEDVALARAQLLERPAAAPAEHPAHDLRASVRMHAILSPADEARLSLAIERGDQRAKDEMITANLRLVSFVARRYRGLGVPFEDLVQEGTVGLVRAVDRFDHRRGAKFSTFAVWWIRRAVIDAVQDARTIRIPSRAGRGLAAVERAETELRRHGREPPSTDAIAERTGLTVKGVKRLREAARVTASLDARVEEDGASLIDLVPDPDPEDPWRRLDERETRRQVWAMLKVIPPRHREVLVRRFGIAGDAQTHAEIGAALGVGEERSRQLERQALHWLRELGGGQRDIA
jgi:RNA polymerase primary sigma factor